MKNPAAPYWATAVILVLCAVILLAMGRVPICECGYVKLWHGEPWSGENSQHIADWYTASHIIHGFIAWAVLWAVARQVSFGWRLALATFSSALWEVIENTDFVIERFRAVTISLNYYGDSVLNSTADNIAMIVGFVLAARLPVWLTVAIALGFEVVTLIVMRDGLLLSTLMLLWPIEAVRVWQGG